MQTVVRMRFGSHLYGTNTPQSDLDYKGVYIPEGRSILLQRVRDSHSTARAKQEYEKNVAGEEEEDRFSLQRYLTLLSQGQTVSLDMLFAPNNMILEHSQAWAMIQNNREHFLTKRSAAFVGYCRQQANKYGIKGSRVAAARRAVELLADAVIEKGTTAKMFEIRGELDAICTDEHTKIVMLPANTADSPLIPYFECCNRKMPLTNTIKQAHLVYGKVLENYGNRALQAENNEGVDWKALSHSVRVAQEALELLDTHKITFPLPNAAEILEIKLGKLPYARVAKQIEDLLEKVETAAQLSDLPDEADHEFIDWLVVKCYGEEVRKVLDSPLAAASNLK